MPADQHGLGRGLEEDRVARGQRGQHAARRDRQREVPGRRHHDDAQRIEAAAVHRIARAEGARVVAREVDRLRDLGIGLGHRLGAVHDHGADQVAAAPGQLPRGRIEQAPPLRRRPRAPARLGGARGVEGAAHLATIGQGVAIGHARRVRAVAPLDRHRARGQLARDLERHRLHRPRAPRGADPVDPRPVGVQGPVGVGCVRERRGEIPDRSRGGGGLGGAVLSATGTVRERVHHVEGAEEAVALELPLGGARARGRTRGAGSCPARCSRRAGERGRRSRCGSPRRAPPARRAAARRPAPAPRAPGDWPCPRASRTRPRPPRPAPRAAPARGPRRRGCGWRCPGARRGRARAGSRTRSCA